MSDLPVPAVLTILMLLLLVLIVLVVLGVRGRRGAGGPAGTEAVQEGAATERSSGASAAAAEEPADAPEEPADAEPADAAAAAADPDLENPVDEDPRPWRERHGRRASRPLLSERSAARTAAEEPAPAQSRKSSRDGEGEPRR